MHLTNFEHTADFVQACQAYLLAEEVVNGLLLGLAIRLVNEPQAYGRLPPYFAAVTDEAGPAFCAVMTPPYNLVLYSDRGRPRAALELVARDLLAGSRPVAGVAGPVALSEAFADVWAELAVCRVERGITTRLYELRRVVAPQGVPGHLRPVLERDLDLLAGWIDAFQQEALHDSPAEDAVAAARQRITAQTGFLWEDGQPVSLAGTARPTLHGITVGLVYTPPAWRGRGYASACVAVLSQQLLDQGYAYCTLFTDLANPTSNNIYQRLGYRPVCDFQVLKFI